jgi:predicted membrane protein
MRLIKTYFWSGLLIVAGLLMIIKHSFNLRFSTPRILFGLVIIYIGCFVLFNGSSWIGNVRGGANLVFGNGHIPVRTLEDEYNIIFSNGSIDMTDMDKVPFGREVKVNVIFGNGTLRINPDIPIVIKMSAVFGSVQAPDRSSSGFGENIYRTPAAQAEGDYLEIEANAVFGRLDIIEG